MIVEIEYLIAMREELKRFGEVTSGFFDEYGNRPVAGSKAAIEQSTFVRPQSVESAWALGTYLIDHGADHVSLFVKTMNEPVEVTAAWTCIRSMLESCSIAAWLLDPTIDAHDRVGRVFAHQFAGSIQKIKFLRSLGGREAEIKVESDALDALESELLSIGYPRIPPVGKRTSLCQEMPGPTAIIEMMLNEGKMYRLMSAVAHAHFWAIHPLVYKATDVDVGIPGRSRSFERTVNGLGIARLGICAMTTLSRPLWNISHYFGWNVLKLEEILEVTADKLILNNEMRFWRS